jgi:predicted nucleotidyltransferase
LTAPPLTQASRLLNDKKSHLPQAGCLWLRWPIFSKYLKPVKIFFFPKFALMGVLDKNLEEIRLLCTMYKVESMYLFGSATNSNFTNNSDIDFLVKFKNMDLSDYFDNYMSLKSRLEKICGRSVDLVEEQTLRNPILINSIKNSKELIYG